MPIALLPLMGGQKISDVYALVPAQVLQQSSEICSS